MGADTRARALEKLSKFAVKIGYPEKWRDYSLLTLSKNDLYGNRIRAAAYEWHEGREPPRSSLWTRPNGA
jgi:putative endopeptidase